jgi:DNA-directed RNA polymerase specialized sigma24 family protein
MRGFLQSVSFAAPMFGQSKGERALAGIPEELRTPLVLVEYENMSQAEIATVPKCTPKAVENRLYRARRLLREKLSRLLLAT